MKSFLFGKGAPPAPPPPPPPPPLTMAEEIKLNKRKVDSACRELDRERMKMEMQEKKVTAEIKKVAKGGHMSSARILAKDLARTRAHISKFYQMRTQMQSMSMQMSAMKTQETMAQSMGSVVQMMAKMNRSMNLASIQKIMMSFEMVCDTYDSYVLTH
jgi:charged multivesicular body protein 2A